MVQLRKHNAIAPIKENKKKEEGKGKKKGEGKRELIPDIS